MKIGQIKGRGNQRRKTGKVEDTGAAWRIEIIWGGDMEESKVLSHKSLQVPHHGIVPAWPAPNNSTYPGDWAGTVQLGWSFWGEVARGREAGNAEDGGGTEKERLTGGWEIRTSEIRCSIWRSCENSEGKMPFGLLLGLPVLTMRLE